MWPHRKAVFCNCHRKKSTCAKLFVISQNASSLGHRVFPPHQGFISDFFSHWPFTLAQKLLDESSVKRQTWNGAQNPRSWLQGVGQFYGTLGELGQQR